MRKFFLILAPVIIISSVAYVWWKYYYVFGEGVKSGYLNYVVYKGDFFKTYEGKLIQEGFGNSKKGGLQSYEFEFSIENEEIFKQLQNNPNKLFDLHYKEYHGIIPWRGNTTYIVDKIEAIR